MIKFLKQRVVKRALALLIVAALGAVGVVGVLPEHIEVVLGVVEAVTQ